MQIALTGRVCAFCLLPTVSLSRLPVTLSVVPGKSRSTGSSNMSMFLRGRAEVTKETLQMAASGCPYKVNNHLDLKYRPRPVHEIITSATAMIGNQKTYLVLLENSNRFVADLRYGWPRRELVRPFKG